MSPKIMTCTLNPSIDLHIDIEKTSLFPGDLIHAKSTKASAGGKGINVSLILSHLNTPSIATGFLAGEQGKWIGEELLAIEQIKEEFVFVKQGNNRINIKIDTPKGCIELNNKGPEIDLTAQQQLLAKIDLLHPEDLFILSGSLAQNLSFSFLHELLGQARRRKALILADVSGRALVQAMELGVDIIKPNVYELGQLFIDEKGREARDIKELIDYGQRLIQKGKVKLILLSNGENGAYFISESKVYYSKAIRILVKSPIGAGDAMVAALAKAIVEERTIFSERTFASALALAAWICRYGVNALIDQRELRALAKKARIEEWKS